MKKIVLTTLIIAMFSILGLSQQISQKGKDTLLNSFANAPKFAINACPGGVFFGIASANLEYLFKHHHGLVARIDYEHIPKKYTEASIESNGVAFIMNYRWHVKGGLKSAYLGAYSRYRIYKGSGTLEPERFDFTISELTIGLNIGKRWVWKSGFNINMAFGYGYSFQNRTSTPDNAFVNSAIDDFEKSYDFIDPFLGEISIGYAF